MSQDDQKPDVRRISRRDQKDELVNRGPLIPDDMAFPLDEGFNLSESDDDAEPMTLADLESLLETQPPAPASKAVSRPPASEPPRLQKVTTPPDERFPPTTFSSPRQPPAPTRQAATKPPRKHRQGRWYHDVIAAVFMLATVGAIGYFVMVWNDPYNTAINPLAPPTPFVIVSETPDTEAILRYYATQTAEAAGIGAPPPRPVPSVGTATTTAPDSANPAVFPFTVAGDVLYAPNSNGSGCNWASIAGSVTGIDGQPLNNYGVQIQHVADTLDVKVFSGSAVTFGPGGFELVIGGTPQAGEYTVQLFSPAGAPVSEVYTVTTRDTCEENVAVLRFVQVQAF